MSDPTLPPPEPGRPRTPLGLVLACGALLFWAAAYLFFFSGGFRGDVFDEEAGLYGPPGEEKAAAADPVARGQRLFTRNCAVCHQPDGQGLPGLYPPLAGSEIVLGAGGYDERHLVRVLLNGLVEPVTVRGGVYNGSMVPWRGVLNDEDAAALLTYVRQAWGNRAAPIAPATVAAVRAEVADRSGPWTIRQLKELPPVPSRPPHSP